MASEKINSTDYYYVWYLVTEKRNGQPLYRTQIARSRDLTQWYFSKRVFLEPQGEDEGINNSDMDAVEHNGVTYIFYAIGNQSTWSGVKVATYEGGLQQLVEKYF